MRPQETAGHPLGGSDDDAHCGGESGEDPQGHHRFIAAEPRVVIELYEPTDIEKRETPRE